MKEGAPGLVALWTPAAPDLEEGQGPAPGGADGSE